MYEKFIQGKRLAELSTFGIGGPARYFIEIHDQVEAERVIQFCHEKQLPYFVLGKGSNCLFSDQGFEGLVILNKIDFCHQEEDSVFYVGAGYSFSLLGIQTARKGFSGLEFAAGIPATVGGAIYMNAGAQGCETQTPLISVEFINEQGTCIELKKEELEFRYRFSSFQNRKGIIVGARFLLSHSDEAKSRQRQLLDYRIQTQPYHEKSAGCVFRNPVGASAGALIDQSGLKGMRIGDAKVSEMHANFLVNASTASSIDMRALIEHVRHTVKERTGFDLEHEIRFIGPHS